MSFDSQNLSKLYYSIGEVADLFDVNTSLIRFWEKEFYQIKPKKNKKGNRLFSTKDIKNLQVIFHLVKERGFTLEGAKGELKSNYRQYSEEAETIRRLQAVKKMLYKKMDKH